jgi:hypothetical protein
LEAIFQGQVIFSVFLYIAQGHGLLTGGSIRAENSAGAVAAQIIGKQSTQGVQAH